MYVIRSWNSKLYHLIDNAYSPDTKTLMTKCGRKITNCDIDSHGLDFASIDSWQTDSKVCQKCGDVEEFIAASDERHAEREAYEAKRLEVYAKAASLTERKKEVLDNEVWPATLEALRSAGWEIEEINHPYSTDYKLTMEVGSFSFELKGFHKPQSSHGVRLGTWEIIEK